jgi:hypothetical protein
MKTYKKLISLLAFAIIICLPSKYSVAQQPGKRLNIIYIMSDDHAYQAISAYGYGLNKTPNIDKLAATGMLFNRSFVTNSICGPSRAVMLTGKFSHINGFKDNHSTFDGTSKQLPNFYMIMVIQLLSLANGISYLIRRVLIIGILFPARENIIIPILLKWEFAKE